MIFPSLSDEAFNARRRAAQIKGAQKEEERELTRFAQEERARIARAQEYNASLVPPIPVLRRQTADGYGK
jgi:hypothetical protein